MTTARLQTISGVDCKRSKFDPDTPPEPAMSVHVDDVALAHVLARDKEKVPSIDGVGTYHMAQSQSLPYALDVENCIGTQ
jgi:hypothetical protein